jgi:hypothetical protein
MPLLVLFACPAPTDLDTADTGGLDDLGDTGPSGDTGSSDDTADTADSGAAGPATYNDVLVAFTVADRGEGFDLDGDGEVDNAMWPIGAMLDPMIAEALAVAQHVAIAQASDVDTLVGEDTIRVGVFTAVDADGDGTDNGSGSETFDAGAQVGADGLVIVGTETTLLDGAYEVELATGTLPVGSYELELATGLFLRSTLTTGGQSGMLGFGISIEALEVALTAEGIDAEVIAAVQALADLDLDGDGTADAVSMAFTFEAVVCQLSQP